MLFNMCSKKGRAAKVSEEEPDDEPDDHSDEEGPVSKNALQQSYVFSPNHYMFPRC